MHLCVVAVDDVGCNVDRKANLNWFVVSLLRIAPRRPQKHHIVLAWLNWTSKQRSYNTMDVPSTSTCYIGTSLTSLTVYCKKKPFSTVFSQYVQWNLGQCLFWMNDKRQNIQMNAQFISCILSSKQLVTDCNDKVFPSPHAVWKNSNNFNAVGKFVMDIVVFGEKSHTKNCLHLAFAPSLCLLVFLMSFIRKKLSQWATSGAMFSNLN